MTNANPTSAPFTVSPKLTVRHSVDPAGMTWTIGTFEHLRRVDLPGRLLVIVRQGLSGTGYVAITQSGFEMGRILVDDADAFQDAVDRMVVQLPVNF
jgi:hypothetical protein